MKNIVLIGMPGCGKSTFGKRIAKRLQLPFYDADTVLEEREQGVTFEVVGMQTKIALQGVSEEELKNVIIAYEPVWAIGTGKTATPDVAEETQAGIRAKLAALYSKEVAENIRIQYGGSMKADNAEALVSKKDIDGGLIGGAALKAGSFAELIANGIKGAQSK